MTMQDEIARRALMWSGIAMDTVSGDILRAARAVARALSANKKVLIFGNGGSAAEAQHFAAELVGRFEAHRRAMPVIALTTDASIITAQANDYDFSSIYSRQIEALAAKGDVVIAMTTSDSRGAHSANIRRALMAARKAGALNIGLFSVKTRLLLRYVDIAVRIPEQNTALIQEAHLAVLHILSKYVESELVAKG